MIKNIVCLWVFTLVSITCYGNGDALWYFGNSTVGLEFDSSFGGGTYFPVFDQDTAYSEASSAVLANQETGDLIFYTDGNNVINQNHAVVQTGLMANTDANQSVVICKVPDVCNQYLIITNSAGVNEGEIRTTVVDVDVSTNNINIPPATFNQLIVSNVGQGLEIIPKSNDGSFWLATTDKDVDELLIFEINAANIASTPHTRLFMQEGSETIDLMDNATLKFKPSQIPLVGTLAGITSSIATGENYVFSATFNFEDGSIVDPNIITKVTPPYDAWDCEWAPDKSILYFSSRHNVSLKQYNFNNGNLADIYDAPANSEGGGLKCGLDNKIYHIVEKSSASISKINSPNLEGLTCDYVVNSNTLGLAINAVSFSSGLKGSNTITTITNDTFLCRGDVLNLEASGGIAYTWSPAAGLSCTDCANPICDATVSTTYQVIIEGGTSCEDTLEVIVDVFDKPTDVLPVVIRFMH